MRKHYIDNIRWITVTSVVIYHVIYMFNSIITEGVMGPVTSFHGQDAILYLFIHGSWSFCLSSAG